jgi:adenylate cyclase class 2
VSAPRRNLELKARDRDPERSLRVCAELGAEDGGTLLQTDTYFEVPRGRLKLREEAAGAHLIAYERPDLPAQKESRYRVVAIDDPEELKQAFTELFGVTAVIRKERRLFVFERVRIHLDSVDGLGDFVEFEGVVEGDGEPGEFGGLLEELRGSFGIVDGDLVDGSYADMD